MSDLKAVMTNVSGELQKPASFSVTSTGSTTARSLTDRFTDVVNVKDWGAKGDGQEVRGSMTSGSATLITSSSRFKPSDVGKGIEVRGAITGGSYGGVLYTTIATYVAPNQVTLTDPATRTVSNAYIFYATDDTLAIQRAICAASNNSYISTPSGGGTFDPATLTLDESDPNNMLTFSNKTFPKLWWGIGTRPIFFPYGNYAISQPLVVQGGQQLIGSGGHNNCKIMAYPSHNDNHFNFIEYLHYAIARRDGEANNDEHWLFNYSQNYVVDLQIKHLQFDSPWARGWTQRKWDYLIAPLFTQPDATLTNLGPTLKAFAESGSTSISLKNHTFTPAVGAKIKFLNHATEYEVVSYNNTLTIMDISPALTDSLNDLKSVVSITRDGSTATATVTNHLYRIGQNIEISGADQSEYNGFFKILTIPTSNTFTFSVSGSPATPATGTITSNGGTTVQIGIPKQNGIIIPGGENTLIHDCFFNKFSGAGIHILTGSPAAMIDHCMSNGNDVGFRIDVAPAVLIKPSGDRNNTFVQAGYYSTTLSCDVISPKVEEQRDWDTFSSPTEAPDRPYPVLENNYRAVFEMYAAGGASDFSMNIYGGGCNQDGSMNYINATSKNIPLCKGYVINQVLFNIHGFYDIGHGAKFIELVNRRDNSPYRTYPRLGSQQDAMVGIQNGLVVGDYIPVRQRYDNQRRNIALRARAGGSGTNRVTTETGIVIDQSDGTSEQVTSGIMPNWFEFSRSGTTATITYLADDETTPIAHNLDVGDYVQAVTYKDLAGSGGLAVPALDPNTTYLSPVNAYSTGALRVKNVVSGSPVSGSQIEVDVSDSGSTGGKVRLMAIKLIDFHVVSSNETRFQAPSKLGEASTRRMFSYYDKQRNLLSGLRVATEGQGDWWSSNSLNIGGTIDNPASRILTGTGAPDVSLTAPNGSIYLRTDGDPSSTVYVRAGDQWRPLGAYDT